MDRQAGTGAIFIYVVLLLAIITLSAMYVFSRMTTNIDLQQQTTLTLSKAAAALEQYVASTGRLPCPADPAVVPESGLESISGSACASLAGTIPWQTIGLRRDDAYDAWGWKISYRVYTNVPGAFTYPYPPNTSSPTTGGASMVNCDTDTTALGSAGVDPNTKLCFGTHATNAADFLNGKGLTVKVYNDASGSTVAQTYTDVAYVLISHGPSGFGAYTAAGSRMQLPHTGPEKDNTSTNPSALAVAPASTPDVAPDQSGHFDDIVVYRRIGDLVKATGLSARNWQAFVSGATGTLNMATLTTALGTPPTYGNLNVSSIYVTDALISSLTSGKLSFNDPNANGNEGIGINGGGSLGMTSGEGVDIKFDKAAGQLGITLNDMGIDTSFFLSWTEQAQIQFLSGGNPVASGSPFLASGSIATLKGCRADGQFASFTVTPGVNFDEIRLTSIASTIPLISSNFYLSGFSTCDASASSCITALETANPSSHCAWP